MAGVKIDVRFGDGIRTGVQTGDARLGVTIGGSSRPGTPASPTNPSGPGNSQFTGNPRPADPRPQGPPAGRPVGNGNGPGNGNAYGQVIGRGNPHNPAGFDGPRDSASRGANPTGGPGNDFDIGSRRGSFANPGQYGIGESARNEASAAVNYLRMGGEGSNLLPTTRDLIGQVGNVAGEHALLNFVERSGQRGVEVLGRFIQQANQSDNPTRYGVERAEVQRNLSEELLYTVQLERHFTHLEQLGGSAAQRAREESLSLIARFGGDPCACSSVNVGEMLRDLRGGALLQEQEVRCPFPLTGSVRVTRELAALLRTIEAIEIALANGLPGKYSDFGVSALMRWLGIDIELARMLLAAWPAFPGRAGRMQIISYCAALGGLLADARGKPLIALDGTPLKLGELLWFSPLGGLFDSVMRDPSSLRLSPVGVGGFDAIFTLVGFDGRLLPAPTFLAIQAQTNGCEPECLYGQVPFSEGWIRALIERLKDSASADNNTLGETLEYALADDRFRLAILRGAVDNGEPVAASFDLALAPNPGAAFS